MKRTDRDRIFESLGAFAGVIGWPLTTWQADALSVHAREQRETAVLGPRRSGKSRGAAILALWWCFRTPGASVLVISSTEEAAKRLVRFAARIASGSSLLRASMTGEQSQQLSFSNGSTLRSTAATDAAVRGWTASLVIADESALIGDDILQGAARPIIASEAEGRFLMISSALTAGGAFYDSIVRGETGSPHTASFRWGLADCEWISPTEIEAARASMSDLLFRSQYLGEFVGASDSLISRERLEAVLVDYSQTPLAELRGPARLAAGWDWGYSSDRTCFTTVGRLPIPGERVFGVVSSTAWPSGFSNPEAIEEVVTCPGHFAWMVSESNGLGGPYSDALFKRVMERPLEQGGGTRRQRLIVVEDRGDPFRDPPTRPRGLYPQGQGFVTLKQKLFTTSASKAAAYSALRLLIEQRRFFLPRSAEPLIRELLTLRIDVTAQGNERIAASAGHDDATDSLVASLRPYTVQGEQGWRVRLAELAEPGRALPEAMLPPGVSALPTVPGPGGLAVPQRPIWQSISGPEITLPSGFDPNRRPESPRITEAREAVRAAMTGSQRRR